MPAHEFRHFLNLLILLMEVSMYTYYCKTCSMILVNWNVVYTRQFSDEQTYEVYENLDDGTIKNIIQEDHVETDEIEDSTELNKKVCVHCGKTIDEVYVEHELLVEIITLLKSDRYKQKFFYGLPIEYKERYTKQDIDQAIFEFKLTNV